MNKKKKINGKQNKTKKQKHLALFLTFKNKYLKLSVNF
jgi:hypothetical protein